MRQWINLMEAKRPVVDHAARAQAVYNQVLKVSADLAKAHYDFRSGWDQTWAKMIQDGMAKAKVAHEADQKEEATYQQEAGRTHTPVPLNVVEVLADVTARWWDGYAKDAAYQIEADAKYEYEDYQDNHPNTEQSDEMSALYDQLEMAKKIYYKGSDTIEGMTAILDAIYSFVPSNGYLHVDRVTQAHRISSRKPFPRS